MTKNLYKTTYEDQEIEYVECTEKEHQEETKRYNYVLCFRN